MERKKMKHPRIVTTITLAAATKRKLRRLAERHRSTMGRIIDELVAAEVTDARIGKKQDQ